jgi:hypothetical protein
MNRPALPRFDILDWWNFVWMFVVVYTLVIRPTACNSPEAVPVPGPTAAVACR